MCDDSSVSPERLNEMRSAIHQFLSQSNVYGSIRDIVDSYVAEHNGTPVDREDPDAVMKIIKERGVIQSLLGRLQSETGLGSAARQLPSSSSAAAAIPARVSEGDHFLHVRLNGGRAFMDSLSMTGEARRGARLFVGIQFGKQRFRSAPAACVTDPDFTDDALLRLDATQFGFSAAELIEVSTPMHVAVFRENPLHHTAVLLGENVLDWRRVLKTGFLGLTVELCGRNAGVPAGIIDLQLELISAKRIRNSEEDILERLDRQREAITAADREFLIYARRWWGEYQGIHRQHKERKVKLFAETTNGRMIPVTHFVSPLQPSRGLVSPLDALRFVSLMKATDHTSDGSGAAPFPLEETSEAQSWLPTFVFASQRQGHSCNHAALLCSLLLGFGLDAYCAIGRTTADAVGTFVLVRTRTASGALEVAVWDPLLGERGPVATGAHSLATVDCLFNHKLFFANVQASSAVNATSFELDNDGLWKPVNPLKLRLVPKYPGCSLLFEPVAAYEVEADLALKVRAQMAARRDAIGQLTAFDDSLSYVLGQALDAYEAQRRSGAGEDFSLFQQCVKGLLGPGKTFKALPINVSTEDDAHIINIIGGNAAGKEIIETIALEDVKFGVRVRVFPFPEGVRSVWVMIAVSYRIQT